MRNGVRPVTSGAPPPESRRERGGVLPALLDRVESLLLALSCAGVATMTVVIVVDAAMRYLFGAPLSIAYDLTRIYLMPAVIFLALPYSMREGAHIGIEFLAQRFPPTARRACHRLVQAIGVVFFALVAWKAGGLAHRAWSTDQVLSGQYTWPMWLAYAIVPVGCTVMALRCLALPYRASSPVPALEALEAGAGPTR